MRGYYLLGPWKFGYVGIGIGLIYSFPFIVGSSFSSLVAMLDVRLRRQSFLLCGKKVFCCFSACGSSLLTGRIF